MSLRQTLRALSTLLLSSVISFAGMAQQVAGDRVAGKVLSSPDGRPLANVLVSLEPANSNQAFATAYTAEDGTFHFDRVPAGKYRLLGQASGFVPSLYLEHENLSTAIVTGVGVDTSSLTLELTPSASISGHIIDDTGEPVVRANIILYRKQSGDENRIARFRNGFTNDESTFDFGDLPPGRYFLAVTATPWYAVHPPPPEPPEARVMFRPAVDLALDVAYPMTFYPAATLDTDALPIDVKPGDDFIADIHLAPVHALSITLPSTDNGNMEHGGRPFGYSLTRTVFGHPEPAAMQMDGFNGTQRITGLAPGQYEIRANLAGTASRDFGPITLSSESITLDSQPAIATSSALVHVSLHTPDGMNLPKNTLISLYQRGNPSGINLNQPLAGKDAVDFNEVPVGDYRFVIYGLGRPLSVAGVQVNGRDSPTRVLHITGTDEVKVDLTLGGEPISIEGYVHRPNGKPSVPSMVILVPAGEDASPDLFRRDQTDLDGSFMLPNVLPGNYLLIAVENAWSIRWNDPSTVMPYLLHAVPIAVRSDQGAQPIHLNQPVISQTR
ncbi:MAG TPA: carboxypeptidase-like regulatory domain-containing protein [Bryocella sp.]|nr:carboxypeptidase-like regulatory domain-containing protein [Bryocella sp.]